MSTLQDDIASDITGAFLLLDEHAIDVTCTAAGGGTLTGIWLNDYYASNPDVSADVMSSTPAMIVAATASTGFVIGDTVVKDSETYEMVEFRPDGQGLVDIRLSAT